MTKEDLKTGMMVKVRKGNRYVVVENNLVGIDTSGHVELYYYDNYSLKYMNNRNNQDYDITEIYTANKYGNYCCVWTEAELNTINNKEYIISMYDNEDHEWDVTISPNNINYGYSGSGTNTPFCISTSENFDNIFLTTDGAKQLVTALSEVLEYLENE